MNDQIELDVSDLQALLLILAAKTDFAVRDLEEWPAGLIYEDLNHQAFHFLSVNRKRLEQSVSFEEALNTVKLRPICSLVDFVDSVFGGFLQNSFLLVAH